MANDTEASLDQPTGLENYLAAAGMAILSACGFCAYALVIVAMLTDFSKFRNNFYPLVISLGISDSIALCQFLFYAAPSTVLQSHFLGQTFDIAMGALLVLAWYSSLPCIISIALNRYWAVCRFQSYKAIFGQRALRLNLALIWLCGVVCTLPTVTPWLHLRYYFDFYSFAYDTALPWAAAYMHFERAFVLITCLSLVACYAFVLNGRRAASTAVRSQRSSSTTSAQRRKLRQQRSEFNLAVQFLVIAVYLIIFELVFTFLPEYTLYRWHLYISSIMYIVNSCLNPLIYLTMNPLVRAEVARLLRLGGAATAATGASAKSGAAIQPANNHAKHPNNAVIEEIEEVRLNVSRLQNEEK